MSKFKKIFLVAISCLTVAVLAITGTVAYLKSEDSAVNVMTTGNVSIVQHEYERVLNADGSYEMVTSAKYGEGYKLQEFTQAKPLYPATGKITGWGTKVPLDQIKGASGAQAVLAGLNNVQDKFVLVENTGKSDAYVRTLIALEYGSNVKDIVGITTGDFWTWNGIGVANIDGNNYYLFEAVYKGSDSRHIDGVLPAGEYTYNSLGQIYLLNEATNEDVEALDGNGNGTYDILVLSQACQTEGFADAKTALDTAFGVTDTTTAAEWLSGMEFPVIPVGYEVNDDAEFAAAVAAGETEIWLNAGTYHAPNAAKGKTLTINGTKDAILEVVAMGGGEANGQLDYNFDGSTVSFNGITIKTNNQTYAGYARLTGTYTDCVFENCYCLNRNSEFVDCTFNVAGDQYNLWTWGADVATFTGCTFNSDGKAVLLYGTANTKLTLNDCIFNDTGVLPDLKAAVEIGNDYNKSYELIVNNATVNGYEINDKGINTGTTLWANKNSMSQDKLNVVVDGVDVY